MLELVKYVVAFFVPIVYLIYRRRTSPAVITAVPAEDNNRPLKTVMQAAREDLAPPKDDPFTTEELKEYDGSDLSKPIYVAIKGERFHSFSLSLSLDPWAESTEWLVIIGTVFDVSSKDDVYGSGKSYNIFAGKDGSRGFGLSSLKAEDAVADYSQLSEKEMVVLNDWHSFFSYVVVSFFFLKIILDWIVLVFPPF